MISIHVTLEFTGFNFFLPSSIEGRPILNYPTIQNDPKRPKTTQNETQTDPKQIQSEQKHPKTILNNARTEPKRTRLIQNDTKVAKTSKTRSKLTQNEPK